MSLIGALPRRPSLRLRRGQARGESFDLRLGRRPLALGRLGRRPQKGCPLRFGRDLPLQSRHIARQARQGRLGVRPDPPLALQVAQEPRHLAGEPVGLRSGGL